MTAQFLTEVGHNVGLEPGLATIEWRTAQLYRTANMEDNIILDIKTDGFWNPDRQTSFFDIKVL